MAGELDLDRLSELEAKATPGPWGVDVDIRVGGADQLIEMATHRRLTIAFGTSDGNEEDLLLLAALRNAAKPLIAAAREAEKLRELLLLCEFSGKYPKCPVCEGGIEFGHAPGCRLAAAIA